MNSPHAVLPVGCDMLGDRTEAVGTLVSKKVHRAIWDRQEI